MSDKPSAKNRARRIAKQERDDLLHNDLLVRRLKIAEAALRKIADYKLVGTEMTLHHDFIGIAKEALAGVGSPMGATQP